MSRRPLLSRERCGKWDQPTNDQFAERWASVAKTQETRSRIRCLSRTQNISLGIMLVGGALFVLMIPVAIVLGIWFWIADIDRPEVFMWGFGTGIGVLLLGALPEIIVSDRFHQAQYADADTVIGVIESVTSHDERDGEGDLAIVYRLHVTARLSDGLTLYRHLEGGTSVHGGPDETWVGRRIRILHNTLDPDDFIDARFDGWPDGERKGFW
ncbi:hypothetical protein DVB87_04810 [Tsukamurella tyrosinosolvens]|nr:hypothetical protein DVB87_04810 [Tsukamurella tyrosinosolvens]